MLRSDALALTSFDQRPSPTTVSPPAREVRDDFHIEILIRTWLSSKLGNKINLWKYLGFRARAAVKAASAAALEGDEEKPLGARLEHQL